MAHLHALRYRTDCSHKWCIAFNLVIFLYVTRHHNEYILSLSCFPNNMPLTFNYFYQENNLCQEIHPNFPFPSSRCHEKEKEREERGPCSRAPGTLFPHERGSGSIGKYSVLPLKYNSILMPTTAEGRFAVRMERLSSPSVQISGRMVLHTERKCVREKNSRRTKEQK